MARVKRAVNAHKKRRTVLERASGYRGQRSRLYRKAKEQLLHSFNYNYRDRKARKGDFRKLWIQRFLAQPTHVAEKFTGIPGVYVPLKETLRGFAAIVDGEMDQYPEAAFYNVGTLEDVVAKAKKIEEGEV